MPHDHGHVLATYHMAGEKETREAIEAALKAKEEWMTLSWVERASIMLKAAELLSKKYRLYNCCRHHARAEQDRPAGRG